VKKYLSILVFMALILSVSVVGWAAPANSNGTRIALIPEGARAAGLTVRHQLGDRVSAHVTDAQLAVLNRMGIEYEIVPTAKTDAPASEKSGDSITAVSRSTTPSSQVPYGIKMIYGNPNLTKSGVSGGAGIKVAVLDTGTIDHVDFYRADGTKIIADCVDFSNKNPSKPQIEGSCADGNGHGTHVIGTVAAAGGTDGRGVFGVAPNVGIMAYKVLNDQGSGYADDIARAIRVAADRGAHVISMSLGGSSGSSLYLDAIRYANTKGTLVIAAAGNSGPNANTIGYPAGYKEVVAVAALNADEVVSYFSSRGITDGNDTTIVDREVEVSGPGRNTISTANNGTYATYSGTSMATPHIAGLAAKMWQGSMTATRSWLVSRAKNHDITQAEQINNAGTGYDIASGYGLPQVNSLSQALWNN
jgi:subtilisin